MTQSPAAYLSHKQILDLLRGAGMLVHVSHPERIDHQVGRLLTNSSEVRARDVFLAYQGVAHDSHRFIPDALAHGAQMLIVERALDGDEAGDTPWLQVRSGRAAWSRLWAAASGYPEQQLRFYGLTGTNGKTSSVWILRGLLEACGVKTASCGTLGFLWDDEQVAAAHTTPDPPDFYPLLQRARAAGVDTVAMEVSSHSLVQEKLEPVLFDGAGFTSFSRDHLDFHRTMDDYWAAKWLLFSRYMKPGARTVFHQALAPWLSRERLPVGDTWGYAGQAPTVEDDVHPAAIYLTRCQGQERGTELSFSYRKTTFAGLIPYWGTYNCENFLVAWLLASHRLGEGVPAAYWSRLRQIPGRLEQLASPEAKRPSVVVDYAHTPDALSKALAALRPHCRGELWVVFGCGGERDAGKRPEMAQAAAAGADVCVVTSDNPRSEEPGEIIAAITQGFAAEDRVLVEEDRRAAIALAIAQAHADDLVLIAGKGHETYQIVGSRKLAFDDRRVASQYLQVRPKQL